MANRIIYLFFCFLIIVTTSCDKSFEDESFTLKKTPNNSNSLRIDGYFYTYLEDSSFIVDIFYKNGVWISGYSSLNFQSIDEEIMNGSFYNLIRTRKYCWGLYIIEEDIINQELIDFNGGLRGIARMAYGKILNDSTINYYKNKYSRMSESNTINFTSHFKEFSPKPDSINPFIL